MEIRWSTCDKILASPTKTEIHGSMWLDNTGKSPVTTCIVPKLDRYCNCLASLGVWPTTMIATYQWDWINQNPFLAGCFNRTRWYPANELVPNLPHKPSTTHQFASIFMFTKVGHYLFMAAWITTFGLPMACQCLHWRNLSLPIS